MLSPSHQPLTAQANHCLAPSLADFLGSLFSKLAQASIPYAVLRNYQDLPHQIGNDLDLMAPDLGDFEKVARNAARECGWRVARKIKRQALLSISFVPLVSSSSNDVFAIIKIDIFCPIAWKGVTVVPGSILENRRFLKGLFYILSPGAEAAISLTKNLFHNGAVQEKYKPLLPGMVAADRAGFEQALSRCLGAQLPGKLAALTIRRDWREIESLVPRLRRTAIRRAFLKQPVRQMGRWLGFLWGHLRQYRHPSGLFAVLIGPDGSGKSTTAARLEGLLKPLFSACRYYHGHFAILPRLQDLARLAGLRVHNNSVRQGGNSSPEKSVRLGRLRSFIYLFYYLIDYLLGHWAVFTGRGRGELLIFDRYYYDYLIQPDLSLPAWLVRSMMRLVPRPDAVIYLKNNPETILSRKAELTCRELARQGVACAHILSQLVPTGHVVETTGLPQETAVKVAGVLLGVMAKAAESD